LKFPEPSAPGKKRWLCLGAKIGKGELKTNQREDWSLKIDQYRKNLSSLEKIEGGGLQLVGEGLTL
jgi:hypothetical protein